MYVHFIGALVAKDFELTMTEKIQFEKQSNSICL